MVSEQTLKKRSETSLPFGKQSFCPSDTGTHLLHPCDCGLCTSILLKEFKKKKKKKNLKCDSLSDSKRKNKKMFFALLF